MVARAEPLAGRLPRRARRARLRPYRDLHRALGIWTFVVVMVVNFSGVYLVFPQTVSPAIMRLLPSRDPGSPTPLIKGAGAQCIDADRAIAIALAITPGALLISIGLPLGSERPYRVALAHPGAAGGAPEVAALINPWSGELIKLTDPRHFPPGKTVLAWQQPLHFERGFGWIWRILICLSGLLPAIFAFTGLAMWLITLSAPRRTVQPLARSISSAKRTGEGQAIRSAGLTIPAAIRECADRTNFLHFSRNM